MEELKISKQAEKLRSGDKNAREVTEKYLERIRKKEEEINAFITINEKAPKQAEEAQKSEKPLSGLPIAVKDNTKVKGEKITYGSKLFENKVADEDSIIVKRLKEAGAIPIGKTNLPEFGLIAYTDNNITGETKNPWNKEKTVGGSSGGSAAAALSEMCPAATGNDGGGSIRIPASFCGLFGLKPSYGRIPSASDFSMFSGMSCEGFLTKTVEDTAFLLDFVKGQSIKDYSSLPSNSKYFDKLENLSDEPKFAFSPDLGYAKVDPEVKDIIRKSLDFFDRFGEVNEIDIEIPNLESELMDKVMIETKDFLKDRKEEWKEVGYETYKFMIDMAQEKTLEDYLKIKDRKKELWRALKPIFEKYDFLITPTVAVPPFDLGDIGVSEIRGEKVSPVGWMPFTYPFNFTKQPAASIPAGFNSEDLPIGLQIVGKPLDDLGVLQVSKKYQDENPWQQKFEEINHG